VPKADRILANLPPTFRAQGDPSALRALVDGYGGELQTAENSLVAVMRAHWVDFADAGERTIIDLALIGALYGLAPRADESVEEFRDHLKRYVRTFLDGTVTVKGILRITAEALGLHIEDNALDTWWTRDDPVLVTEQPGGADAAVLVFGVESALRQGHDALPAVVEGDVDLRSGVDLRGPSMLRIALDGHGAIPVDLTAAVADPAVVTPAEIVAAVNAELGLPNFATVVDGRIRLTSQSTGPAAEIAFQDGPGDAAELVLGLRSRSFQGADATRAQVTGTADLSTQVDLTQQRYLRISIDGHHLAEIDCAALATNPAAVDIAEIADAINDALGISVATHDGRFLTVTSPTPGTAGFVAFFEPAAQPATGKLFGAPPPFTFGTDERRATVVGDRELGLSVDLRESSQLRLAVDAEPAVTLDIAGASPEATTPAEIVAALNEGLATEVASHDGNVLTLVSGTAGVGGALVVEEVEGDAAEPVLGLRPRVAHGGLPSTASLTGTPDLSGGVDLSARHILVLSVDGGPAVEINLRHGAADPAQATVDELADAVNAALGASPEDPVATHDGAHLILVSPQPGSAGRLEVTPLRTISRRRFVTRARVTDDAATAIFGFTAGRATGSPPEAARILGANDLSGGADLAEDRYLRVNLGGVAAIEVDCAGPRPRATTPQEIVDRINDALGVTAASTDGRTVALVSPVEGADSLVALEPPRARDALDVVFGVEPGLVRGQPPTGVRFTGTADLAAGLELPADAALRLAVDSGPATDIVIGDGTSTTTRTLSQMVVAINQTLVAQVAAHDGSHLLLTSPTTGAGSRLEITAPIAGTDATADVLGISAPREYDGSAPTAATVIGTIDLTAGVDLTNANLLSIAVDGGEPVTVDLTTGITDPAARAAVTASQIATAINSGTNAVASTANIPGGLAVAIASPTTGLSSRIELTRTGAGDAAPLLFGSPGITATGTAALPATLDGTADLLAPVDLSERSVITLAVDGESPVDVDVAGVTPAVTLLGEVVAAINDVLPGVAQATAEDRLRIVSPTAGPESSVELVPLRFLEVVEYPPAPDATTSPGSHGTVLRIRNSGAAAVPGRVELTTTPGVAGPRFAAPAAGWSVRVHEAIGAGGALTLESRPDGGLAAIITERGASRELLAERLEIEPVDGTGVLVVNRGLNSWSYSECRAARFGSAVFDSDRFAGGPCSEEAVFDLSRFGIATDVTEAVFATAGPRAPTAQVQVSWESHAAGRFVVNLPAELDRRFGVAFGDGRFGTAEPELLAGVVTEPEPDDNHIVERVNRESALVEARPVPVVPIGWSAVTMPFRDPTPLTLGSPDATARLYLSEPGLAPGFVELQAAEPGVWGNDITVTARASGPAIYDLEIGYPGDRFEVARQVVFGPPLPTLADQLLAPGPVGVGTAKAAGIHAEVTRDRVVRPDQEGTP
jgi:hypothetical protein